jgi:hypothetical protein
LVLWVPGISLEASASRGIRGQGSGVREPRLKNLGLDKDALHTWAKPLDANLSFIND